MKKTIDKLSFVMLCIVADFYILFSLLGGQWNPKNWIADYKTGMIIVVSINSAITIAALGGRAIDNAIKSD